MAPNMISHKFLPGSITAAVASAHEDSGKNPITGHEYTRRFRDLLEKRRKLPVYRYRQQFLDLMHDPKCRVVILTGETGSGKSTQLPGLLLLDRFAILRNTKTRISCTEPRKVAARGLGVRVAAELDVMVGEEVAFAYRNSSDDDVAGSAGKNSLLTYETDGKLLAYGLNHPNFDKIDTMFIDEAHQRTAQADVLLAMVKRAQRERPDLKLVIMSATIALEAFRSYFADVQPAVLEIPGRTFNVTRHYASSSDKAVDKAFRIAAMLHLTEPEGDILIFIKSKNDMEDVIAGISGLLGKYEGSPLCGPYDLIRLHAQLSAAKQNLAIAPGPLSDNDAPGRKIIVATNVAEASITIDGVVYVIDTGEAMEKQYDPRSASSAMLRRFTSKQQTAQRGGRAGRTQPGEHILCMSPSQYFRFHPDATIPGMLYENTLESVCKILLLLKGNPNGLLKFNLLDPPATETVMRSLQELYFLNFVDIAGVLTQEGISMANCGIAPHAARMIARSALLGCTSESITMVAMQEAFSNEEDGILALFIASWGPKQEDCDAQDERRAASKARWQNPRGDIVGSVAIYDMWISADDKAEVCSRFMWNENLLWAVQAARDRIVSSVRRSFTPKISRLPYSPLYFDTLSRAVCLAYATNAAVRSPRNDFKTQAAFVTFKDQRIVYTNLGPDKVSALRSEYVVFDQINLKHDRLWMKTVTPVKLSWLVEACPRYFDPEAMPPGRTRDALIDVIYTVAQRTGTKLSKEVVAGRS